LRVMRMIIVVVDVVVVQSMPFICSSTMWTCEFGNAMRVCPPRVVSSYLHCNTILLFSCCVSYKARTCVVEEFSVEHRPFICGTSMEDICVMGSFAKSSLKTLHVSSVI
jgi:hypothetical protein